MAKVNIKKLEKQIRVRQLAMDDFDALVEMQKKCFPGMVPWERAHIESQIEMFPEGQLCVEYKGQLVASSSSLIVDFEEYSDWHNWKAIADSGYIRNHIYDGDTLYGIEIMVHPEFRGLKLSRRLYDARKEVCRRFNVSQIIIAGRIPGYHQHADTLSAREYVEKVMQKALFDPVLTAQTANGFVLKGLIPNYLPADDASCGYATFLEWTNLDYVPDRPRRWSAVSLVRLCVVQYEMRTVKNFKEFATQCEYFFDTASDYQCDFALFPEYFTAQLMSCVKSKRPGLAARQLADFTSQFVELFNKMSLKYNINVVGGAHFELGENDVLNNVSFLFRRDGSIEKQYKLHITPAERRWWGITPGNKLEVFDTDRGKIAILIGYDVEFPEVARIAAKKGANILFVPFDTDNREGYLRIRYSAMTRCIENHVYAAISGCTGNLPFVDNADLHYAQSGIYCPSDVSFSRDGIVAECTPNIETLIIHDVDLELLRRAKHTGTVQNWQDRRQDLYRVTYEEDGKTHQA